MPPCDAHVCPLQAQLADLPGLFVEALENVQLRELPQPIDAVGMRFPPRRFHLFDRLQCQLLGLVKPVCPGVDLCEDTAAHENPEVVVAKASHSSLDASVEHRLGLVDQTHRDIDLGEIAEGPERPRVFLAELLLALTKHFGHDRLCILVLP